MLVGRGSRYSEISLQAMTVLRLEAEVEVDSVGSPVWVASVAADLATATRMMMMTTTTMSPWTTPSTSTRAARDRV